MEAFVALSSLAIVFTMIGLTALGVALACLLQYRLWGLLAPEARVATVLLMVAAGALLSVMLTSRTLDDAQRDLDLFIPYEDYARGFAASRWLNLLLVGAALIEVIRGVLAARRATTVDPARPVAWAMLAYYLGTALVQGVASEHPAFFHQSLYVPVVLLAVYCQRVERVDSLLAFAKAGLFALTAGSLVFAALVPDFVLHRPEPGLIPGIDWRLYGLTEHANTLAPAALLAIVIEVYSPSRRATLRGLQFAAAAAVLVLAQSRTAWVAALAIVACVGVPLALIPGGDPRQREMGFRRATWVLVGCLFAGITVVLALFAFGAGEMLARSPELNTFNGRKQIWDLTLEAWRENRLFGYGAEVWGVERQWKFHLFHVGHAHNQLVQTLGEAGLAGAALLGLYIGALLRAALTCFASSRGFVLALLVILLVRFITEAPMRSEGPLSWSAFLHLLIVVLACHWLRQPGEIGLASLSGSSVVRPNGPAAPTADSALRVA